MNIRKSLRKIWSAKMEIENKEFNGKYDLKKI